MTKTDARQQERTVRTAEPAPLMSKLRSFTRADCPNGAEVRKSVSSPARLSQRKRGNHE